MSDRINISIIGNAIRIQINASDPFKIEECMEMAEECLDRELKVNPEAYLQTFVAPGHLSELQFFLQNGYYIANTLLTMECELDNGFEETETDMKTWNTVLDTGLRLKEYIEADEAGFEMGDSSEKIAMHLEKPCAKIYISEVKGVIASAVTTWQETEEVLCTENIFTIPKYRGRHLASTLLKEVLHEGKKAGFTKARLTVYGDNIEAMSMYLGLGYEVTGTIFELNR